MKLIGLTGSCGKTSVAEILYQYFLYQGVNASLYCSNGIFVNGLTKQKDFFQSTLYGKDLEMHLKEDEEALVEYTIVEITAESVMRQDMVHTLPYEVIGFTGFFDNMRNHFDSLEHYYSCKRKILSSANTKSVLLRLEDTHYRMFSDLKHKTYGYTEQADYTIKPTLNTINGLELMYQGVDFYTNLIGGYHARNIACALAILSELNHLDLNGFKEFAKSIFIRGRFEKINYQNKNIILDTGYSGVAMILSGLERTLGNANYKVIFSSVHYEVVNEWVMRSRKTNGKYLQTCKFIYLTNPTNSSDEEDIFINDVIGNAFTNFLYIPNIEDVCQRAMDELQEGETLMIFTRAYYRYYRQCIENYIEKP